MTTSPIHSPTPEPPSVLVGRLDKAFDADLAADFKDSVAANTWRSYRADLKDFDDWSRSKGKKWSSPATVAAYLRTLGEAGAAYATIERRKTAIAKLVEAEGLLLDKPIEDPTKHPKVTVTLKAIRRRIGTDQEQSSPLTADRLIQVLLSINETTLAGRRDLALLLIGFYGGFRRSEIAGMRRDHLELDNNGVVIQLPHTKSSQNASVWVPIHRQPTSRWDPITILENWITALDIHTQTDVVWPRLTRGDNIYSTGIPIGGDAINQLVSRHAKTAGLAKANKYSAHSLRSGFVTEAKNRGIDEADIMKHTRHKSIKQMRSYDRQSGWWNRNATATLSL